MNRKTLAIVLIVLAAGLLGYWLLADLPVFTQTEVLEKVVDPNDPFQAETEVWKEQFTPGLDLLGSAAAVCLVSAGFLLWSAARRRRHEAVHASPTGSRTTT